ncbi:hypothetical protein [Polaribacter sp. AHE13PA]|uniref:hypothetical protein n=1 Tax=Polaribacter sp. AHE13PA TaxID=2745562 RepID=UPI001C4EB05C|nr:hypothetical protein [Polaribacter sp. AHE13PA]QXP68509.1 hypothetical protein H0I28_08500 [Polaribacter sp. AHE13PA]
MNKDAYNAQDNPINDRKKTVKRGPNVLHLEYLGGLSEDDLKEINENLSKANLELSSFNKSGVFYNSIDEYSLVTYFVIHQVLIIEILKNIGTSALWDSIKWSLMFGWNKLKGKTYHKGVGSKITEEKVKFGLSVKLDENTGFNFELDGNLDKEIIESSLDKVFDFLKEQKVNDNYKIPDYVYYSEKEEKWLKIDVIAEIIKKTKNNKNKALEKILKEKRKTKKK